MHYKDGTPAKVGDRLKYTTREYDPETQKNRTFVREGLVVSIQPGQTTCNAVVYYLLFRVYNSGTPEEIRFCEPQHTYVTLGECVKVVPEPE